MYLDTADGRGPCDARRRRVRRHPPHLDEVVGDGWDDKEEGFKEAFGSVLVRLEGRK